ncbi:MAG: hypothetical protein QME58_02955 [Bacteroidota bacterium]|nr:hypothetical protein [Bacteroidota bacterium]
MSQKPDDLEAVRAICIALEPFDETERGKIIKWASERIGIKSITPLPAPNTSPPTSGGKDIKTFLEEKNPTSANQLVAAVAYYYKFEAPASEKKNAITKDDLMEASRKANRERPKNPNVILVNAKEYGLVDKVGTGAYEINAVGENLVAVSMPGSGHGNSGIKKSSPKTKNIAKKKK